MFRRVALSLAVAAGLIFPLADSASAGIAVGAFAAPAALAEDAPIDTVQYVYGGRNYCYYESDGRVRAGTGAAMRAEPVTAGAAPMAGAAGTTPARAPPTGMARTTAPPRATGMARPTELMPATGTAPAPAIAAATMPDIIAAAVVAAEPR